ncbi:MAG: hypothetical protein D6722_06850 [Bacteroidetes bacterium]|nr:MAG: hypothetical protein D6722_06850 [Bacteroidota bacterium]
MLLLASVQVWAQPSHAIYLDLSQEDVPRLTAVAQNLAPGQAMTSPFRGGEFVVIRLRSPRQQLRIEVGFPRKSGTWKAIMLQPKDQKQIAVWGNAATGRPLSDWEIRTIYQMGASPIWALAWETVNPRAGENFRLFPAILALMV